LLACCARAVYGEAFPRPTALPLQGSVQSMLGVHNVEQSTPILKGNGWRAVASVLTGTGLSPLTFPGRQTSLPRAVSSLLTASASLLLPIFCCLVPPAYSNRHGPSAGLLLQVF